jgi:hypothetical protein
MSEKSADDKLSALELNRIAPPQECERLAGVSWKTIKRSRPDKVVYYSARRIGMRVKDGRQCHECLRKHYGRDFRS